VNGDSKNTIPWLVRWACRAGTRIFCSALAALVSPVQKIFFPHRALFEFLYPHHPESSAGLTVSYSKCLSAATRLRCDAAYNPAVEELRMYMHILE